MTETEIELKLKQAFDLLVDVNQELSVNQYYNRQIRIILSCLDTLINELEN